MALGEPTAALVPTGHQEDKSQALYQAAQPEEEEQWS